MKFLKDLKLFSKKKKNKKNENTSTKSNINMKNLTAMEKDIIHNTLELKNKDAREIMVPRVDVCMISIAEGYEKVINSVSKWGLTRVPVYEDNVDDIVGVLYVKDLVSKKNLLTSGGRTKFSLRRMMHEPYFIPESKPILELLKEFQEKHIHIGMVVDEYGGFSGIVTLEDVLEEIVGEIHDEYDVGEESVKKNDDGSFQVDARLKIEELHESISITLPQQEADTVGGFLFNYLGRLPKRNEKIGYKSYFFTVVGKSGNIVTKIRIEKKKSSSTNGDTEETNGNGSESANGSKTKKSSTKKTGSKSTTKKTVKKKRTGNKSKKKVGPDEDESKTIAKTTATEIRQVLETEENEESKALVEKAEDIENEKPTEDRESATDNQFEKPLENTDTADTKVEFERSSQNYNKDKSTEEIDAEKDKLKSYEESAAESHEQH